MEPSESHEQKHNHAMDRVRIRGVNMADHNELRAAAETLLPPEGTKEVEGTPYEEYRKYVFSLLKSPFVRVIVSREQGAEKFQGTMVIGQDEEDSSAYTLSFGQHPDRGKGRGEFTAATLKMCDELLTKCGVPSREERKRQRASGEWEAHKQQYLKLIAEHPIRAYIARDNKDPLHTLSRSGLLYKGQGKGAHADEFMYELSLDALDQAWDLFTQT